MTETVTVGYSGRSTAHGGAAGRRAVLLALVMLGVACGGSSPTPGEASRPSTGPVHAGDGEHSPEPSSQAAPVVTPATSAASGSARDPRWAIPLLRPGLPNLHRVSDALLRGAQPERAGFQELYALGVKTVVNLRSAHSDRALIESSRVPPGAFQYVEIPMKAWDVDAHELVAFLRIAADPARQPIFVHCEYGADRTGVAVASYRVAVEGWSPADAAAEMTGGGFGFHSIWSQLARQVRALDPARLRREAQIASPLPAP